MPDMLQSGQGSGLPPATSSYSDILQLPFSVSSNTVCFDDGVDFTQSANGKATRLVSVALVKRHDHSPSPSSRSSQRLRPALYLTSQLSRCLPAKHGAQQAFDPVSDGISGKLNLACYPGTCRGWHNISLGTDTKLVGKE